MGVRRASGGLIYEWGICDDRLGWVFNSLVIDLEMLPSVRECHCLLLYCTTAVVQECPDSSYRLFRYW